MCRESCSSKCCIDNGLLALSIVLFMILYMYILSQNQGIIYILVTLSVLTLIFFLLRVDNYGCPDWIKYITSICRDELIEAEEN